MSNGDIQYLNVRKVFRDKTPKLAKIIPGFLYCFIERIIHQDGLNDLLSIHGHKFGAEFSRGCMEYHNVSIDVKGIDNIPLNGRYLFVSNHPLGGFDGIMLMTVIAEKFGDVRVMVNDILMNIENLRPVFLPINKHGSHSKEGAKTIDAAFETNIPILTFPAGLCSRKIKGKITDLEWKKNFLSKAINFKRDIVPIYFNGRNSNFFYNLSNFRKRIGIKINIEMFFLVDELYKHRNGKFSSVFGKPIQYKIFDKRLSLSDWAEKLKKHVYRLKDNPEQDFNADSAYIQNQ
jgi:1-acyl-sn-glycerol-3-phosphate acyltransferase